jgi:molecular chaperone DnaK
LLQAPRDVTLDLVNERRTETPIGEEVANDPQDTVSSASGIHSKVNVAGSIGRFQVRCILGAGSFGCVYRAFDTLLEREVALKVPKLGGENSEDRKRFLREAKAAAQLRHPNIVAVYECGQVGDEFYLASELIEGETLATRLERQLPERRQAVAWVRDLALALAYAHSRGIVHRDIKPGNVMLGKDDFPQLLDFGLAKKIGDDATVTVEGSLLGTPAFMSPEQARGDHKEVGPASDQYSLGAVLYELLSGKRPFDGPILSVLAQVARESPPRLRQLVPDLPAELDAICAQAMAREIDQRYPGIEHFAADLDNWLKGLPIQTRCTPAREVAAGPAIGIDLGTSVSAIAHLDASGRAVTLANSVGDLLTPSAILIDQTDVIIGKDALRGAAMNPAAYADAFKRDLGRAHAMRRIVGHDVPPEVFSALLLAHLKDLAEHSLGLVRQAVIGVPAHFDESRRMITEEAGKLAGLEVLDIINEPAAAAIAYAHARGAWDPARRDAASSRQRLLVFDLGGGKLDATLLELEANELRMIATDGDLALGGIDFDQRLAEHLAREFQAEHRYDPRSEPRDLFQLRVDAHEAKHALSARSKTTVVCRYGGRQSSVQITREKFEQLTEELLKRAEAAVSQVIVEAGLKWHEVDRVLLVGGSSRMPMIAQMLRRVTGKDPDRSLSPDEAVAHGAALYAGMLSRNSMLTRCHVVNVNAHSLGAVVLDPKSKQFRNIALIPKNTTLPHRATRNFKTAKADQRTVKVSIVEGDADRPEACIPLGECVIRNLPPGLPKGTPIQVEYGYESNGRIAVTASIPQVQQAAQVEIVRAARCTSDDLATWRKRLITPG